MKKVITYGTYDLFHYGHFNLLKRAKALGDYLVVGVSSDDMCLTKGKKPVLDQNQRLEIISCLRFVDEVILEENMAQKVKDVEEKEISVFVLGGDYRDVFPKMPEYEQLIQRGCEVVFFDRTPDISTTSLKKNPEKLEQID